MLQVRLADVKLADSRDQRRVETPPRVLMKNRAAADRAARAAAAAANGEGSGQANNRFTQHPIHVFVTKQLSIFLTACPACCIHALVKSEIMPCHLSFVQVVRATWPASGCK